jgi:hypothetical protein
MTEEKDEERGFRVTDRRRFAETGEARPDAPAEAEPGRPAASEPAVSETPESPSPAAGPSAADAEPVSFSTFVLGLSTQALSLLGEIPDPHTGQVARDLVGAKHLIDILGILRGKTRNNLAQGEESLLDSILYDLRMRYVELARSRKES